MAAGGKNEIQAFIRSVRRFIPYPSKKTLRRWFPKFEERNIAFLFAECNIDHIIDIGANAGQFAGKMRSAGYKGKIISFEPVQRIHDQLVDNSRHDPLWTAAPRMALGSSDGEAIMNIMDDPALSSVLDLFGRQPSSRETVPMRRLDSVLQDLELDHNASIALKIDVQGLEQEVLDGAPNALARAKAILIELSLSPTYVGETNYLKILNWLYERQFDAVYFCPVVNRPSLGKMYQVDALLVKRPDA